MEKLQSEYFEALTKNRTEDANALDRFALRGVKHSVVEKYSDQAHFIYELLQNADDAKATSARFELFEDRLIFAHNGTRRFSVSDVSSEDYDYKNGLLGDINAITAVGSSNKIDEATIGKFGVGFKAVFQYTATPHIYDPDIFFKIERFIVPNLLDADYIGRKKDETLFLFPFDHESRTTEDSYVDISEKLHSLDYPLLFLTNLKDISFTISDTLGLYGKLVEKAYHFQDTTAELIALTQNEEANREELSEHRLWLFSRTTENNLRYSVGFFVNEDGALIPKKHTAFCFFPTKETTNLNFIVHAPFLLTDSREGIRAGAQHNVDMIELLSALTADSLIYLKEIGDKLNVNLINDDILDIIPYNENDFSDVNSKKSISFKPFYLTIKDLFKTKEIIPTFNGYVAAPNAYWGGIDNSQLAEVFSNKQLAILTDKHNAKWAFPSLSTPRSWGRTVKFEYVRSIIDNPITDTAIIELLDESFIEQQEINWLHKFYKYISVSIDRKKRSKTKPIFLSEHNHAVAAFNDMDALILFLPIENNGEYITIHKELLKNEDTLEFIQQLGISKPALKDEIFAIIFPQYDCEIDLDVRLHFKKFFAFYQEASQKEVNILIRQLKNIPFVLSFSEIDADLFAYKPNELFIPSKFLKQWFGVKPETRFVALDEYINLLGEDCKADILEFFGALGIKNMPNIHEIEITEDEAYLIKERHLWPRPAYYNMNKRKWIDKSIDGCKENIEKILQTQDCDLSFAMWKSLALFVENGILNSNGYHSYTSVLTGEYKYFYHSPQIELFPSSLARLLRTKRWLINTDGNFISAEELTRQTLNAHYDTTSAEIVELLNVLEIENDLLNITNDRVDISSFVDSLGFSENEAKLILKEAFEKKQIDEAKQQSEAALADSKSTEDTLEGTHHGLKRVVTEITKRVTTSQKSPNPDTEHIIDTVTDEDEYSKPKVDLSNKVERIKKQAEKEIQEIALLEDLMQKVETFDKYSYGWFKALLELESLNSGEHNSSSKEISISFSRVEQEKGASRTLILKHPNRYIPQTMESLADIPLELHFANLPTVKVAIEVVNVKSYTLRVKLRNNVEIDNVDLSLVVEAKIEAKNPIFLIEELRKSFNYLGETNDFDDNFDMQGNLCENIDFIFGPPGTGKTTHLAQNVILPLMKNSEHLKVLVLTPTNKAADVLTQRIIDVMSGDTNYQNWLVRFGATGDNTLEQIGVFRDKTFDIRTFPRNVTVTTIARFPYDYFLPENTTRLHLEALKWDYIIIDEASMIPLANIIYPLYKKTPKKFIIAGDPFQIEPITTVTEWKNENIYTMVELNSFSKPTTVPHNYNVQLLTTQYRSIPEIGNVFSQFAYSGILQHYRTSDSRKRLNFKRFIDLDPLTLIKFPISKYESIYRPKRLQGKTPYQVYSALFAFEFLQHLASQISELQVKEIFRMGLIAPYRAQADLIDRLLSSIRLPSNVEVQVGTIHGFQGDECDLVVALFNPPPYISSNKDMFLNKLNIVNVSISRARDYLIVIMPDENTENIENLTLINKVEALCKSQKNYQEYETAEIETVLFNNSNYIEENAFSTSHQLVNVYRKPERRYEIRTEESAVDIQIHDSIV